jgi:2-iminobutanoate/2-iminopropanoate deaminase
MTIEPIATPSQPWAAGPYSPAVRAGDWIVCSGQVGIDPATGSIVMGGIESEARQALANVTGVLADAGATWADVAKVTLFVGTMSPQSMDEVNAVYTEALGAHRPARSTIGVAWLPMGAVFEVEVWAYRPA